MGGPELFPPVWRTTLALGVVLALLFALGWLLKRRLPARRARRQLTVEAALPLGERRSLAVVSIEGRRLLIGLAPGNVSLVTELQPAESFDKTIEHAMAQGGPA